MRNLLFAICLAVVAIGCKKVTDADPVPQQIIGRWELRSRMNSAIGIFNIYPAGNGDVIVLNADHTYKKYVDGILDAQGHYNIINNSITADEEKYNGIYFDDDPAGQALQLKSDTLSLGLDYDEEIRYNYLRQ